MSPRSINQRLKLELEEMCLNFPRTLSVNLTYVIVAGSEPREYTVNILAIVLLQVALNGNSDALELLDLFTHDPDLILVLVFHFAHQGLDLLVQRCVLGHRNYK